MRASFLTVLVATALMLGACENGLMPPGTEASSPAEGPGEWRRGMLLVEPYPLVTYQVVNGQRVYEGDVLLEPNLVVDVEDEEEVARHRQGLLSVARSLLWPNGVIPYTIDSSVSATLETRILSAIAHYREKTPVRFVPRTNEAGYATFRDVGYEQATPGFTGARQYINLASGSSVGVIIHEMGHCTGLKHEHMRPDRDEHVTIHYENIRAGYEDQFAVFSIGESVGEYDIGSVMHYGMKTWSANDEPTITRKDGSSFPTNFQALSAKDIAGIEDLYGGTRPKVAIASPAPGATISGTISISASAVAGNPTQVHFFLGSVLLGTDSSAPFALSWDTTSHPNGDGALTARSVDAYGREATSAPVAVQIENVAPPPTEPVPPEDTEPPADAEPEAPPSPPAPPSGSPDAGPEEGGETEPPDSPSGTPDTRPAGASLGCSGAPASVAVWGAVLVALATGRRGCRRRTRRA